MTIIIGIVRPVDGGFLAGVWSDAVLDTIT